MLAAAVVCVAVVLLVLVLLLVVPLQLGHQLAMVIVAVAAAIAGGCIVELVIVVVVIVSMVAVPVSGCGSGLASGGGCGGMAVWAVCMAVATVAVVCVDNTWFTVLSYDVFRSLLVVTSPMDSQWFGQVFVSSESLVDDVGLNLFHTPAASKGETMPPLFLHPGRNTLFVLPSLRYSSWTQCR